MSWFCAWREPRRRRCLVLVVVVALTLSGCAIYFDQAAQRECGGDWSYQTRCPPLTFCNADEDTPLRGGRCVPLWSWVFGRR
jgi:hypothetical protein